MNDTEYDTTAKKDINAWLDSMRKSSANEIRRNIIEAIMQLVENIPPDQEVSK